MKRFSNYIHFDTLDNQLIQQCAIHEAFIQKYPIYYTFESIGLFPHCKQIIQFFENHIHDLEENTTVTYTSSEIGVDVFFKEIRIVCSTDKTDLHGEYMPGYDDDTLNDTYEAKRWNINERKFNFIDITLKNIELAQNTDEILEILTHELTHAWDDYILHKDANSTRDVIKNDKIKNKLKNISDNIKLEQWKHLDEFEKYQKYLTKDIPYIKTILYYLDTSEEHSYLAQVNQELKNKKFANTKELIDYLNANSPVYSNYKIIYELFATGEYDETLKELGFTQSSINIFKKKSKRVWNKLINHIYHILYDEHIDECVQKENTLLRISDLQIKFWNR